MARGSYDPLQVIPSSDLVRRQLDETTQLARRLRVLLKLAERLEKTKRPRERNPADPREFALDPRDRSSPESPGRRHL